MNHKLYFEESFTKRLQGEHFLLTVAGELAAACKTITGGTSRCWMCFLMLGPLMALWTVSEWGGKRQKGAMISSHSCLGLQQVKKAEWAWGWQQSLRKTCSAGSSTEVPLHLHFLPASPLCSCLGGSPLCSRLGNSDPCGWAKGSSGGLWGALSNGGGRRECTICWQQGLSSPQQGPGKAVTWPLLIELKMWESTIWQEANKGKK